MSQAVLFAPDEDALSLAEELADAEDVHRDILQETIESGEGGAILESGRTVCGTLANVKSPIRRFSRRVTLDVCPISVAGGLHSHVTEPELKSPGNSLPDIATVVYGQMDVSGVVGTDSAEFFVRADDQQAAKQEFNEILGVETSNPEAVVDGIMDGSIDPNRARAAVRTRLGSLFMTRPTGYYDLRERVEALFPVEEPVAVAQYDVHEAQVFQVLRQTEEEEQNTFDRLAAIEEQLAAVETPGDDSITNLAIGATVGTVVGSVIERVVVNRLFE